MPDLNQNGKQALPQIPEGELYLFARLNPKTNEFSCLFSDLLGGLALIPLAQAHITNSMIQPAPAPQTVPGDPVLDVRASTFTPLMLPHFRRGRGN
jgi:hypothetical protein